MLVHIPEVPTPSLLFLHYFVNLRGHPFFYNQSFLMCQSVKIAVDPILSAEPALAPQHDA
jgi:hypothetical protein